MLSLTVEMGGGVVFGGGGSSGFVLDRSYVGGSTLRRGFWI